MGSGWLNRFKTKSGNWIFICPTSSSRLCFRETAVPVCLVGNKQDLCHAREVCEDEGRCLAQENRCHFQEVSAAESYQDIANLFTQLIRQVMEHLKYRADRRRYSGSKSMAKLINNVFGKRRKSVWWLQQFISWRDWDVVCIEPH